MPYIVLAIYLLVSLALQFLAGDFPVSLFAFPLNIIVAIIWFSGCAWLWKGNPKSMFVRFMLSPAATFWSIFLFIDACVVVGLTGDRGLTVSWPFIAVVLFLMTVLLFVVFRGYREKTATGARLGAIRWRFLLNHLGLLLALGFGFWGAPDSETMLVKAYEGVPVKEAYSPGIGALGIGNELLLNDFILERHENGAPSLYQADLLVDGEPVRLKVNHPYSLSFGKDIYLVGYDTAAGENSEYCIMQIVDEPWRYGALAGVLMMLLGAFLLFLQGPRRNSSGIDD